MGDCELRDDVRRLREAVAEHNENVLREISDMRTEMRVSDAAAKAERVSMLRNIDNTTRVVRILEIAEDRRVQRGRIMGLAGKVLASAVVLAVGVATLAGLVGWLQ